MVAFVALVVCALVAMCFLVVWRWEWIKSERTRLSRLVPVEDHRFNRDVSADEDDQTYHGRIIKRLRARVIEGRVEVHWEYNPEFILRGFVLTGQFSRNGSTWQPLPLQPQETSGSWIETFNYSETCTYLFTVKKSYWFFGGLLGEEPDEMVGNQISFAVRKGRYRKEKKEQLRDRADLVVEAERYVRAMRSVRQLGAQ